MHEFEKSCKSKMKNQKVSVKLNDTWIFLDFISTEIIKLEYINKLIYYNTVECEST